MRQDLQLPPRLDRLTVGVIPGDTEQLVVPSTFAGRSQESVMIDRAALLRDLKPQLRLLEDDLRQRSADVPEFDETLHLEWEDAKQSNRTASHLRDVAR